MAFGSKQRRTKQLTCPECDKKGPATHKVCKVCGGFLQGITTFLRETCHIGVAKNVWRDKEGNYYHISDMDTEYLFNCVKYLLRRSWILRAGAIQELLGTRGAPGLTKKQANLYAQLLRSGWQDYMPPIFYAQLCELQLRGTTFGIHECNVWFEAWLEDSGSKELVSDVAS